LHVLSLPPAFNLSHDQTLQFNLSRRCIPTTTSLNQQRTQLQTIAQKNNY
jgi:hypothetical protein